MFSAVFVLLKNNTLCQMKEKLARVKWVLFYEEGYNAVSPVSHDLVKLHRPGKYLEFFPDQRENIIFIVILYLL